MNIPEMIKEAHGNSVERGFYPEGKEQNIGEKLMLIVSELGEALEAHRCKEFANWEEYIMRSDNIKRRGITKTQEFVTNYKITIKDTFEDEIANVCIRLFDLCGYLKIDIEKHIKTKMAYNRTRPHKHGKEY